MTTRKTSFLLGTTSAVALSVFAYAGIGSTEALAACASNPPGTGLPNGGVEGTDGDDVITCIAVGPQGGDVFAKAGDDIINVTLFSSVNDVNGDEGSDTITVTGAEANKVSGGVDDDVINIATSLITGDGVFGDDGADTINVTGLSVVTFISGGNGNDEITFDALGFGGLDGGDGDDLINLDGGVSALGALVNAGGNDDTINLNGTLVLGDVTGSAGEDVINIKAGGADKVLGGGDNDVMTMTGGIVADDVDGLNGEGGDDTIDLQGGFAAFVGGGSGNDLIQLNGADLTGVRISGQSDDDEIQLMSGTAGVIEGGSGEDLIELDSATVLAVVGDVFDDGVDTANGSADTINLNGGEVTSFKGVGGDVWGQGGNDQINLNGTIVEFDIRGGADDDLIDIQAGSADTVQGDAGQDSITMSGGTVTNITGDTLDDGVLSLLGDSDFIEVNGGVITGDIWGQGGDDTIIQGGADIAGNIRGGFGDDGIGVFSGTVGGVVQGDADEDFIFMNGGTVLAITGDTFVLNGELDPGDNDLIVLEGGVIDLDVWGQGGDDTIVQDGADIARHIRGGIGNDDIGVFSGTLGGVVQGDAGEDFIFMNGGTVLAITGDTFDDMPDGMGDNDLIVLQGGAIVEDMGAGGEVWGQGGDDTIIQAGADIANSIRAGNDDDLIVLADGTVGGDVFGNLGDDTGVVTGDFDFAKLGGQLIGDDGLGDDGDDLLVFDEWIGEVDPGDLLEWNDVDIVDDSNVMFAAGTLDINGGSVFIEDGSELTFEEVGTLTIEGSLQNDGEVDLAGGGNVGSVLQINGDYDANSELLIDTFLDDGKTLMPEDNSDILSISGSATGETEIFVTSVGDGPGGLTGFGPDDGILVVATSDSTDDAFTLGNDDLTAGIFEYFLANPEGQLLGQDNWYLQSDYLDQIYVYENLPGAMQTIGSALTGQLVERVGVRSAVPSTLADADGNPVRGGAPVDTAIWGRAVGLSLESDGDLDSTTGGSFDQTIGFLQAGADVTVLERPSGRLLIGALGHWGTSTLDANNSRGTEVGTAGFDFYGGGLTATWYSTGGWYFDNVVQYTAYDIDISTSTRWPSTSTDGYGISASHELGYRIPIGETAALVPQGQITYQHLDFDDFTDPDGVRVSLDDGDSLVGRLGVAFENNAAIGSALATGYVEANVMYEFLGDNSVNTFTDAGGNIALEQQTRETWVEVGFGGTIAVAEGVSLYGEVDYALPLDGGVRGVQALGGIRVNLNPPPAPPPPAPVIAPVAETAFIVFFDWDRADLTSEANLVLDDVVVVANQSGYASVRLDGYTDLSGSAAYNLGLSERRANSVANGLIARGIAPDEIVIRAFGEENPLVPTPDGVREPQNRRVEIFLS